MSLTHDSVGRQTALVRASAALLQSKTCSDLCVEVVG